MSGKGQKHLCKNAVEATTTLEKNSTNAQNVLLKTRPKQTKRVKQEEQIAA